MRPRKIQITEPTETMKLVDFVNKHGLKEAAEKYGTSTTRLSIWIRNQGFQMTRQYHRENTVVMSTVDSLYQNWLEKLKNLRQEAEKHDFSEDGQAAYDLAYALAKQAYDLLCDKQSHEVSA